MFDELRRALRRLENVQQVSVSLQCDEDGYFDRECPSEECTFLFKVHFDDWGEKVGEEAGCPFCGHSALREEWNTEEQTEHIRKTAISHINKTLGPALRRDAERWNRRQPRNSFISITMNVTDGPRHIPVPPAAAEPMRLRITCSKCECRYAVIGAAYFCPACGHSDAEVLFGHTISGIRRSLCALTEVRAAISDPDAAATTVRSLVENGLQSGVTAFQRYAEALYSQLVASPKPRRNAFQNLAEGSELWHNAARKNYSDYLTNTDMMELKRAFQQRHLLAHTQGIVDQDYITHSSDTSQRVGQRLVIRESTVHRYLDIIEKLTAGLLGTTRACLRQSSNQDSQATDDA